tara:strand:- start:1884 stop:2654 length:771 start_codon:yes stop_codon:yes gene_type:complete
MSKTKIKETPTVESWEVKDRNYFLIGKTPLTYTINSKHSQRSPLLYFDPITSEQRALRYATNQPSPFIDEQKGEVTLAHIMFQDGALYVPKEYQALQKLLSLYHPKKDYIYAEHKPIEDAKDQLVDLEIELLALNAAQNMEIDHAEAVLRVEMGSSVSKMSTKEIKRDLMLFAKRNAKAFLSIAKDDNVQLRNFGIKAVELGIVKLSGDQRTFAWGSNGRKLMTIPFDENPYSALAAWFKTDEGVEVYQTIEKKFS